MAAPTITDYLNALNTWKAGKGLPPVSEEPSGDADLVSQWHADYMADNRQATPYEGNPTDPTNTTYAPTQRMLSQAGFDVAAVGIAVSGRDLTADQMIAKAATNPRYSNYMIGRQYKMCGIGFTVGSDGLTYLEIDLITPPDVPAAAGGDAQPGTAASPRRRGAHR